MPHLEKNLSALAARFPALAAQVAATALNDFQPAKGSDGTLTYARIALSDDKKKIQWLGHTSMPAAGAPHVIKSLDPVSNGQNGLGLSVGTGFEWAAFVERLPRAQMVYVYEPDLATLKMALDVCDLASHLRDGRIVLLAGASEAAAHQLAEFLGQNLGFDPPAVLHPLPTLMVEQRNAFLSAGEAIVRHGMMERQGLLNALHEKLMAALRECQPSGTTPAAAASAVGFLLTPRHRLERPIQGQIPQLAAPPIYLDHHASASLALRFQMLSAHASRGAVAIKSDLFRAQLPHIPAEIPLETWVPPLIGPGFWERVPAEAAFGPRDTVIVHHAHHAGVLRQRGIAESRLRLLPLTMSPPVPGTNSAGTRVAMVADLPPSDPGSLGIQLPTHLAVFAAARELIAEDYLAVHPTMAGDILRRALSRAGIDPAAEDPALKEPMLRIIRDVLIPAVPPLTLAANLAREGLPLLLIGAWPNLQLPVPSDAQRISFDQYTPDAWGSAALLIHLSPEGTFSPLLLEAIAGGVAVAAPTHPTSAHAGAFPGGLAADRDFAQPAPRQLIAAVKTLLRDGARRERLATAAKSAFALAAAR